MEIQMDKGGRFRGQQGRQLIAVEDFAQEGIFNLKSPENLDSPPSQMHICTCTKNTTNKERLALAQSMEHGTLDLRLVRSSPMLDIEITSKKKKLQISLEGL